MTKKIEHNQMTSTATDSDCNLCDHEPTCRRLAGIESLHVPTPYTVTFECEHFKRQQQRAKHESKLWVIRSVNKIDPDNHLLRQVHYGHDKTTINNDFKCVKAQRSVWRGWMNDTDKAKSLRW